MGQFIVFEGVEGAGKTTQIGLTQTWLQTQVDCPILVTREPGGTLLGQGLRHLLLHGDTIDNRTELLLFAADRAEHVASCLRPALAAGSIILCDRYTDSTLAYQHYGRGLDRQLIDQLNDIATAGLKSHVTFWLDLDVEIGLQRSQKRGTSDRIEQADLQFHQRVQAGFGELTQQFPQRIIRLDAQRPTHEIQSDIRTHLGPLCGIHDLE